jgi:hypothetical protein
LNADDLVVGGENIFAPEAQLLVVRSVGGVLLGFFSCWLHDFQFRSRFARNQKNLPGQIFEGRKLTSLFAHCQRRIQVYLILSNTINPSNSGK